MKQGLKSDSVDLDYSYTINLSLSLPSRITCRAPVTQQKCGCIKSVSRTEMAEQVKSQNTLKAG